jgi:methionyl-tRNA synthetase
MILVVLPLLIATLVLSSIASSFSARNGITPQEQADRFAVRFVDAWRSLGVSNDDFIRTTERRHQEQVQELWRRVKDAGDIYLGEYEDWYCVGCESFYTEKELLPGRICAALP